MSNVINYDLYFVGANEDDMQENEPFDNCDDAKTFRNNEEPGHKIFVVSVAVDFDTAQEIEEP